MATDCGERLEIDVTFDIREIKVRHEKHMFVCSYDRLFSTGLVEHDLKSKEKAIELLKAGKMQFSHYEKEKKLFLKYGVQGLDLFIIIGIPRNLFDLDVESCDEKEQLQYYKNKAIGLEKIISMNHMALKKYTVSEYNENSVYRGFTSKQITENYRNLYGQYGLTLFEEYRQIPKTGNKEECKQQNLFCVARDLKYVGEDDRHYVYINLRAATQPLVEVTKYENEVILNVRRLTLNQHAKRLRHTNQFQELQDAMSQDILIGVIGEYDLMETRESDPLSIYLSCCDQDDSTTCFYGVENFYKFVVHSNGNLVLKYLYSTESVRSVQTKPYTEIPEITTKKLQHKARISGIRHSRKPPYTNQNRYPDKADCVAGIESLLVDDVYGDWPLFEMNGYNDLH